MSVWTLVKGTINLPENSHFSLNKSIKETFESSSPKLEYGKDKTVMTFSFVEDGFSAARQIDDWIGKLPKGSRVDLEASIRFLR